MLIHRSIPTTNHKATLAQPKPSIQIRTATPNDQKYLTAALMLAFSDDPIMRWMYPDSHQYLTYFPEFIRTFGGPAFGCKTTYVAEAYAGAALWFAPGIEADGEALIGLFQRSVFDAQQAHLLAILDQMDDYHPHYPHWYLSLLAVEPTQQRKGYGSALLQPVLAQCDRDRLPAYLESSKPSNIAFYQHHGFEVIGTIQAGDSPPLSP
ncbi:MAG: GNAT family N-acetyltransferase [Leptolyngbyaceae cyanobacterium SM2_5_2]|nr:GNAT family N-acetyltransferase [Leptolyngbyaceae cyanobacterium SM2_5_2]